MEKEKVQTKVGSLMGNFLVNAIGKFQPGDEFAAAISQFFFMAGASVAIESFLRSSDPEVMIKVLNEMRDEIKEYMDAIGATSSHHESLDKAILAAQTPVGGVN